MQTHKPDIEARLSAMRKENLEQIEALTDRVSIEAYRAWTRMEDGKRVWTDALQRALDEHAWIDIPAAQEPYYIDASVRMPSNRHIEAQTGAVIRLLEGVSVLMLRNEHTQDGTHAPIPPEGADENVSIRGGRWEEYHPSRAGYGKSGKYDEARSFFGVSTYLFFNHLNRLTLQNITFAHTAGFAVQVGDVTNALFENIAFDACHADGLHINGNSENVWVHDISGKVGDDLVALNMYDWQNSSVDFGPGRMILCEDLISDPSSRYKSLRIEPGVYTYADGHAVDCSLTDAIIRRVQGIYTFKMYYQTPRYAIGSEPEPGHAGSCSHIYFEDIDIDLISPVDRFPAYLEGDPLRGAFGAFELGAHIDCIFFENLRVTLHRDLFPRSYLITVGPKSIRRDEWEIFDPYISNHVGEIVLKDVFVNGKRMTDAADYVHVTRFDDVNGDGHSTARGSVERIMIDGSWRYRN